MKAVRTIGLGLLAGPAIALAVIAGSSQAASAAVPSDIGPSSGGLINLPINANLLNSFSSNTSLYGYPGGYAGYGGYYRGFADCCSPGCY